jgi:hypothetical protein
MATRDKDKIAKAGFATPRGGAKGAYQNHVLRSNKVIIPYERLEQVTLAHFKDGYVVRLFPEQYFDATRQPRPQFLGDAATVVVGVNAFVLYRTHDAFQRFPPLANWQPRHLERNGIPVQERGTDIVDVGHYVRRLPAISSNQAISEGPPQGIFAPEYADVTTNFLCQCVLAWLIVHASGSPYTSTQAQHLEAILRRAGVLDVDRMESHGILRRGITCCPLCLRFLRYEQLHQMVSFSEEAGVSNASEQVAGATRSTIVNLFHMVPLSYSAIEHISENVAWGHAICNTRLGQRRCIPLPELISGNLKVGIITEDGIQTFGWISSDFEMIRSSRGAVWIRLHGDMSEPEWAGEVEAPVPQTDSDGAPSG